MSRESTPDLFSALPDELLSEMLRNLPIEEIAQFCRISRYFNQLASDHPVWKAMLNDEELDRLGIREGNYKALFATRPGLRKPKFQTYDRIGQRYVFNQSLANEYPHDRVARILAGEEPSFLSAYRDGLRLNNLPAEVAVRANQIQRELNQHGLERIQILVPLVLREFFTINDVLTLQQRDFNNLQSGFVLAFIQAEKLTFSQFQRLTVSFEVRRTILGYPPIRAMICAKVFDMDAAVGFNLREAAAISYNHSVNYILQGKLTIAQARRMRTSGTGETIFRFEGIRQLIDDGQLDMDTAVGLNWSQAQDLPNQNDRQVTSGITCSLI